jgi:hypothetical protein
MDHPAQGESRLMKVLLPLLALVLAGTAAEAAYIAPHRAVYDLRLATAREGAGLASADGRMVFEIAGSSCEGWTVSFRMVNRYQPIEGKGRLVDIQSVAYESGDFLEMHYSQKEFVNNRPESDERVRVSRQSRNEPVSGEIIAPEAKKFSLPAEVAFPTQHQLHIIDAALRGESRDASLVYDGSDGEKPFRAITQIGRRREPGSNIRDRNNAETRPLAALPYWPMTISYYPEGSGEDLPSYQISFDMYENGVATGLKLDYGDFALRGSLAKLEMLKAESCD